MSIQPAPDMQQIVASLERAGIQLVGAPPPEPLDRRSDREGAEALAAAQAVDARLHTEAGCPHLVGESEVPAHEPSALILGAARRTQDGEDLVDVRACLDCHEHCRVGCGLDRTVTVLDGTDDEILAAVKVALEAVRATEHHPSAGRPSALEGRRL